MGRRNNDVRPRVVQWTLVMGHFLIKVLPVVLVIVPVMVLWGLVKDVFGECRG